MNEIIENPLVSIVVVTYNHEEYLKDALEGILMQTVDFEYEVIIHDDASTDRTVDIIKEYQIRYPNIIKPILQQVNLYQKGFQISRIFLNRARGKYIAMCEGDDYWTDSNKLAKQVSFLEQNKNYVACYHNVRCINENKKLIKKQDKYKMRGDYTFTYKHAERMMMPGQTASLVYRNLWLNMRDDLKEFYFQCKANGDNKLAVLLTLSGGVFCSKEIMADHRIVTNKGDSWSASTNDKNLNLHYYKTIIEINKLANLGFGKLFENKDKRFYIIEEAIIKALKEPNRENIKVGYEVFKLSNGEVLQALAYRIKSKNTQFR